jgi:hypothetical protein
MIKTRKKSEDKITRTKISVGRYKIIRSFYGINRSSRLAKRCHMKHKSPEKEKIFSSRHALFRSMLRTPPHSFHWWFCFCFPLVSSLPSQNCRGPSSLFPFSNGFQPVHPCIIIICNITVKFKHFLLANHIPSITRRGYWYVSLPHKMNFMSCAW